MKKETVASKAREAGLEPHVVYNRVNRGWTLAKALKTPVRGRKKNKTLEPETPLVSGKGDGIIASAMIIAIVVTIIVALMMEAA